MLYLAVKTFTFHCKKTVTLAFPRCGKCLSSQKLRDLVRGSSSDAIRKKLFLSSCKFVTHLSCRSCLILRRAVLMDSWADDTGNSRRGFAGPNQGCLIHATTGRERKLRQCRYCCIHTRGEKSLPEASRPGLISAMRPDLPQPTHGLIPENPPRSVLFT